MEELEGKATGYKEIIKVLPEAAKKRFEQELAQIENATQLVRKVKPNKKIAAAIFAAVHLQEGDEHVIFVQEEFEPNETTRLIAFLSDKETRDIDPVVLDLAFNPLDTEILDPTVDFRIKFYRQKIDELENCMSSIDNERVRYHLEKIIADYKTAILYLEDTNPNQEAAYAILAIYDSILHPSKTTTVMELPEEKIQSDKVEKFIIKYDERLNHQAMNLAFGNLDSFN